MTPALSAPAAPPPPATPAGRWEKVSRHIFAVEPADGPCTCPALWVDAACERGIVVMPHDKAFEFFPVPLNDPWPVPGSAGWVLQVHETRCEAGVWWVRFSIEQEQP